jgi:hypothetical protein
MTSFFQQVVAGVIGGWLFGLAVGITVALVTWISAQILRWVVALRARRKIKTFYGLSRRRPMFIVYSSIQDPTRNGAYSVPMSDTTAARILTNFLAKAGFVEDKHYFVYACHKCPTQDVGRSTMRWTEQNVVLLCSPRRNSAYRDYFVDDLSRIKFRLTMEDWTSATTQHVVHTEGRQRTTFQSSRDQTPPPPGRPYDYGLIRSLPNPHASNRRLVIMEGIHGSGTIGCAKLGTDLKVLGELCGHMWDRVSEGLVLSYYSPDDVDRVESVRLVAVR